MTTRRTAFAMLKSLLTLFITITVLFSIASEDRVRTKAVAPENAGNQSYLPVISLPNYDWPTLAANPQRTSWTAAEVRGDLQVEWYHPIEPYIHYKIQPIVAAGKVFVSTARGLYAFNTSNGALVWVYPTELPLGHSPTVANINGKSTVFVGGYDRKIHAIDVETGLKITGYAPFVAGSGFETNPLVIENVIYAGNRDGYFYALDAITGAFKWKYKTDGPIHYSAAYHDNTIYFASDDARAYALNKTNGALVWKSNKLPGAGFHTYWPVVYTDKSSGKTYVIFTSGENYRFRLMNVVLDETITLFNGIPFGGLIGPTSTSIPGDWVQGTMVINANKITNYLQNRPDRRLVFVLDANTGSEFTFDSNGDSHPEYAPFISSVVTHAGPKYPPVINGIDGVYYQATAYVSGDWVSRGGPVGWKLGTSYISRVDGNDVGHASDEPLIYSSGGKLIYWGHCCDREAGAMDVTIPFTQPDRAWQYISYNLANNVLIPGYQQVYNSGNSADYNNEAGWQVYSGKNLSKNGLYGKHGTSQSPPIPSQGKLFLLRGNALIAFSPTGTNPKTPLPLATIIPAQSDTPVPAKSELTQRLEGEVQKIVTSGVLRPGYHDSGFLDLYGIGAYTDEREFGELFDYFQSPADTVYTLLLAYPHLTPATQGQVKTYLQNNFGPGKTYDLTRIVHVGWGTGSSREVYDIPSEVVASWGTPYTSPYYPSTQPICGSCGYWQNFPPFSFYAAWKYAQVVGNNDPAFAKNIFDRMSGKLETPLSDAVFIRRPYWLNLYIAGYQGYLELQKLAGYPQNSTVLARYQAMLNLRVNHFVKDTPYLPIGAETSDWEMSYNNSLAVARNFMFLTPELADYMESRILNAVNTAVVEYEYVAPYWFVSKIDVSYGEGTFQPLYDYPALFQAKAYILNQPYAELVKWLDVPAFYKGDLFYIQNLVAALQAEIAP
jgi:outer membrane protein assembly factor BamB